MLEYSLMPKTKYKRVLLKLSGETFLGERKFGIDPKFTQWLAKEIGKAIKTGSQISIVVGGGNIFRGTSAAEHGLERTVGDYIGMLATIMNSLALQAALEKEKIQARVLTSIEVKDVAEPYIRRGAPYFTTDTTAAQRALEIAADIILKGTKVDGVYDKDPHKHDDAKKLESLSLKEALTNKHIEVLDNSALSLCMDHKIPILVFNLHTEGNIVKAVSGEKVGTLIS